MAFALTVIKLEEAMQKTGCPVCRLEYEAALQSIDAFLWENVNDPQARQPIQDALGFCPQHTRLLVAKELMSSGSLQGVNIIYSLLAKTVSRRLKQHSAREKTQCFFQRLPLLKRVVTGKNHTLAAGDDCPLCKLAGQSALNILSTLFEELNKPSPALLESLQKSPGICLCHLRSGLEAYHARYPRAGERLIADTLKRLEDQQNSMQEYLRKQNWAYRDEPLTPEESSAWLQSLTFFTGLPPERFSHHIDPF